MLVDHTRLSAVEPALLRVGVEVKVALGEELPVPIAWFSWVFSFSIFEIETST